MSGIFMFILFLLNIITIFAVIVLFLRQNRFMQVEKNQKTMMAEMEELMSGYIMEMKEENEALLEKLSIKNQSSIMNDVEKGPSILNEMNDFIKELPNMEEQNHPHLTYSTKNQAVEAYKNQSITKQQLKVESIPLDEDRLEVSIDSEIQGNNTEKATFVKTLQTTLNGQSLQEPTLHEQVNLFAMQGLSAEEIAQKLKCGKTEVELLLKFQNGK